MKAIILCAGYATRLYPLTENMPKALLPVKGKPILDYLIEKVNEVREVDSIYIISNSRFYNNFSEWLSKKQENYRDKIKIVDSGSDSVDDQKGPINDCLIAINKFGIDDDVLFLYGDNLFSLDMKKFIDFSKEKSSTCLACYELSDIKDASKFGIANVAENNKITDMEEKPQQPRSNLAVTGIYLIRKEDISKLKEFYEKSKAEGRLKPGFGLTYFVIELIKKQEVYAFSFSGEWLDIGSKEDYEKVK